jgi:sulfur-carrier protein
MHVKVKLFATLRRFALQDVQAGTPSTVELEDGASLADLISILKLPAGEVRMVFVNGRSQEEDWILKEDDEVGMFPPIGGG